MQSQIRLSSIVWFREIHLLSLKRTDRVSSTLHSSVETLFLLYCAWSLCQLKVTMVKTRHRANPLKCSPTGCKSNSFSHERFCTRTRSKPGVLKQRKEETRKWQIILIISKPYFPTISRFRSRGIDTHKSLLIWFDISFRLIFQLLSKAVGTQGITGVTTHKWLRYQIQKECITAWQL